MKSPKKLEKSGILYFTLLVVETKDLSETEQLAFVVRYTFEFYVHEEFIVFRATEDLNAESLSGAIQDEMKQIGTNINNLVVQGYDGAAVMSGRCSGVQQRIREIVPQAIYAHCLAHRLNLVIVQAVNSVVPVTDFFATLQLCYNFLSGSNVHSQWFHFKRKSTQTKSQWNLKQCRKLAGRVVRAVSAITSRFDCFIEFLRHVDRTDANRDRALVARNILGEIDLKFVYCMVLMYDVLLETKGLSDSKIRLPESS